MPRCNGSALALAVLAAASLCACTGDDALPDAGATADGGAPAGDAGSEPALVELGVGETSFEPVTDGDTVFLVHGFQGLQHVWVSLRTRGLDPDRATIELPLVRERDGSQGSEDYRARLSLMGAGDFAEKLGLQLVVLQPDIVVGQDSVLRVQVTDRNEVSAAAEARVRVAWQE